MDMKADRFTIKSQEAINRAGSIAAEAEHQARQAIGGDSGRQRKTRNAFAFRCP